MKDQVIDVESKNLSAETVKKQQAPKDPFKEAEKHVLKTCRLVWFLAIGLLALFYFYAKSFYINQDPMAVTPMVLNIIYGSTVIYFLVAVFGMDFYKKQLANQIVTGRMHFAKGLQRLAISQIIKYSLLEACAINGLVLAVMQQDLSAAYGFIVVSVVGLLMHFPLEDRVFQNFPQIQVKN